MSSPPKLSIILPTYNRAAMLAEGLESIASQTFTDWELIVVDDGSTDRNRDVVAEFQARVSQPVQYHYQTNQGPGAARRTALQYATAPYIAFMDSDDPWLPHHLSECVAALEANLDVSLVFGPARVVNEGTGTLLKENSFYPECKPHPFLNLKTSVRGDLKVIVDPLFPAFAIANQSPGALQASVLRREVLERVPIRPYRLYDDVAFFAEMIIRGFKIGYLSSIQFIYRIHEHNTSLVNPTQANADKRIAAYQDGVGVYRELLEMEDLSPPVRAALRRKLAEMTFWSLGYNGYLQAGRRREAFECFWKALRLTPGNLWMWKTLARQLLPHTHTNPGALQIPGS